jgi:hypothetical protein
MFKPHRWLLPALVLLVAAAAPVAAHATALVEHNAQPLGLTPNAGSPPEFGRCIKQATGEYEDTGCTKSSAATKHYEWYPAFGGSQPLEKTSFSTAIKETTLSILETVGTLKVTCKGQTSGGKYTGNKTVGGVVVTFTGCTTFELSCHSSGQPAGTIVTTTLEGTLGLIEPGAEAAEDQIGERLYPTGGGTLIASFSCEGLPVSISGSLIGQVQSNVMKLTDTVKFKQSSGKQMPEAFFGEPATVLSTQFEEKPPEQAGEALTTVQTNEEKIEINSVV